MTNPCMLENYINLLLLRRGNTATQTSDKLHKRHQVSNLPQKPYYYNQGGFTHYIQRGFTQYIQRGFTRTIRVDLHKQPEWTYNLPIIANTQCGLTNCQYLLNLRVDLQNCQKSEWTYKLPIISQQTSCVSNRLPARQKTSNRLPAKRKLICTPLRTNLYEKSERYAI